MKISKYFDDTDLACHDGTAYPFDQADDEDPGGRTWRETRAAPLLETADAIRDATGPLISISAFRTLAYDTVLWERSKKDGSKARPENSEHPKGRAMDARSAVLSAAALFEKILDLYRTGKLRHLGGVGLYGSFCHFDVRERPGSNGGANDGHLSIWGAPRPSDIE
jgi:hypothetical protein